MVRRRRFRSAAGVGCRGFTLLEIMLAIALIAVLSAAMIGIAVHLTDSKPTSPPDIFWQAVTAARKSAVNQEREVHLSFDDKAKAFSIDSGETTFEVPNSHDLAIDFLQQRNDKSGLELVGGQVVDTKTIPFATFYPDGTCSPFRLQIHGTGPAQIISIDPWTCAPILAPADPNKP